MSAREIYERFAESNASRRAAARRIDVTPPGAATPIFVHKYRGMNQRTFCNSWLRITLTRERQRGFTIRIAVTRDCLAASMWRTFLAFAMFEISQKLSSLNRCFGECVRKRWKRRRHVRLAINFTIELLQLKWNTKENYLQKLFYEILNYFCPQIFSLYLIISLC